MHLLTETFWLSYLMMLVSKSNATRVLKTRFQEG